MSRLIACILLLLTCSVAMPQNYIPPKAYLYKDMVHQEVDTHFPGIPVYEYMPALIEHESCLHLRHTRCWSPTSTLNTKREFGAGLGMVTKAFNADGSIRFDSLTSMRRKYQQELSDASWATIRERPDIQVRMMVLMVRDCYDRLYEVKNPNARLHMADACYNGGISGVLKEQRKCSLTKGCDPTVWFDNVELHCLKSRRILYDNRNACDINRHHVRDVVTTRTPKYIRLGYFTSR